MIVENSCVHQHLNDDPNEEAIVLVAKAKPLFLFMHLIFQKIAAWPRLIEAAAGSHEPHRAAFYLYELASEFHAQWTRGKDSPHLRFIIQSNPSLTAARLALVQGVVTVLASGLALLGVGAPEEMR